MMLPMWPTDKPEKEQGQARLSDPELNSQTRALIWRALQGIENHTTRRSSQVRKAGSPSLFHFVVVDYFRPQNYIDYLVFFEVW